MSEKTCATCRHWHPPTPGQYPHGTCGKLPQNRELSGASGECSAALAFTEDMERYASNLRCAAEFGCVLHELGTSEGAK